MLQKLAITSRIRMGMVGGGLTGFIGDVHRRAAALDGGIELVCGAFSRDIDLTLATGASLGLSNQRLYASYEEMFRREASLPAAQRMQFVSIVTPNHLHVPVAKAALEHGFHVLSDKPASLNLKEALRLKSSIEKAGLLYGLTYTYLGYPMVKQARSLVRAGKFGQIRKVFVEYPQGWLSVNEERAGSKQADWRTDPSRSGISGCIGDIGTHAFSLAEYVSGQEMTHVCAELATFVEGRRLDDDGAALFRMNAGASGVLIASQICAGEENGLRIRVYGELGGLEWNQTTPNSLQVNLIGEPKQTWRAGKDKDYLCAEAKRSCRLPSGHPEGYLEAFANLYRDFASLIDSDVDATEKLFVPGIDEGVRGMAFVEAMVESSRMKSQWTAIDPFPVFAEV